ncbi:MAG: phosphoadenosine phosphosulfate reductase family protein, partial [Halanaerobiales bacterium]|nr:phosphoadenosine phosphosulfate reductase family protein [Halanaerobiales bacterium]
MPVLKKQTLDKSTYELAIERINRTYDIFDEVWVSFSAGKDSTAVLNLAIKVAKERDRLPVKVIFFDEEAIPYHNVEYVERVRQLDEVDFKWCCLPLRFRNACSRKQPWWWPWNK